MVERKKAFSLVEALISMVILTVVGILITPVFTAKKKPVVIKYEHGSYVCIYVSGRHYQRYNNDQYRRGGSYANTETGKTTEGDGSKCVFEPWEKTNVYSLNAIGKGAPANSNGFGNPAKMESAQAYVGEKLNIVINDNGTSITGEGGNEYLTAQSETEQCEGCTNYNEFGTSGIKQYLDINNIKDDTNNTYNNALNRAGNGGESGAGNFGAAIILW